MYSMITQQESSFLFLIVLHGGISCEVINEDVKLIVFSGRMKQTKAKLVD